MPGHCRAISKPSPRPRRAAKEAVRPPKPRSRKPKQISRHCPRTVDSGLHKTLSLGIANLRRRALALCVQPLPQTTSTTKTSHPHDDHQHPDDTHDDEHQHRNNDHPDHPHDEPPPQPPHRAAAHPLPGTKAHLEHRVDREAARASAAKAARVSAAPERPSAGRRPGKRQMSEVKIAGRYRLEGRLGFGGMSTVHLALDLRLERQVAVKLLAEHLADDPTFVSRFQREAQAAARLVHPNIVQIFDSGLDEPSGRHFIVMEYIEGPSCAEILRDDGWVEVDEAVSIIDAILRGPGLCPPSRSCPSRRQARQPAARARGRGQARRLRHRQGDRAVYHHPGRLGPRYRRLPGSRAGAWRGGRPSRRPVCARGRRLPADLRAPAL